MMEKIICDEGCKYLLFASDKKVEVEGNIIYIDGEPFREVEINTGRKPLLSVEVETAEKYKGHHRVDILKINAP